MTRNQSMLRTGRSRVAGGLTVAGLPVLLAAGFLLAPAAASAQTMSGEVATPEYNLQRWRPAPNPSDLLTVHGASVGEHLRLTGGMYFNFATDPLAFNTGILAEDASIVDYQFYGDVFVSFSLFDWVDLGIALPVGLVQGSETNGEPFDRNFEGAGLGDLRVVAKGRILEMGEFPVGLGIVGVLNAPTGDESNLYGDGGWGFDALIPIEYSPWGNIRLIANVGYRFRETTAQFASRFTLGDSVLLSGGASIPFFHEDLDLILEVLGEVDVDADNEELVSEERPVEGEIGIRWRVFDGEGFFDDLVVTGAFGIGSGAVGSPTTRTILGVGYQWVNGGEWAERYNYEGVLGAIEECPDPETTPRDQIPEICRKPLEIDSDGDGVPDSRDKCPFHGRPGEIDEFGCSNVDMDGDGIPDAEDNCPAVAEDFDGYQDRDGCPDLDNDGDGIADVTDKCPLEQEVINGIDDQDGCPDIDPDADVFVDKGKLNIKEQVFFETGKAKIKQESFDLLNQVAKVMNDNPHIGGIEIEGHTDDRGDDASNLKLSQDRANAVLDFLVGKGVEGSRLNAIGYGEARPIETNETSEGRAKNRRVEFTIRGIDDKSK